VNTYGHTLTTLKVVEIKLIVRLLYNRTDSFWQSFEGG